MTNPTIFDSYGTPHVPGFDYVRISSEGSVSTVEPQVRVFFVNSAFDEQFTKDLTTALKSLTERLHD